MHVSKSNARFFVNGSWWDITPSPGSTDAEFQWTRSRGPTATQNTGPTVDNTQKNDNGQ